jgi:hypothetical protein
VFTHVLIGFGIYVGKEIFTEAYYKVSTKLENLKSLELLENFEGMEKSGNSHGILLKSGKINRFWR